MSTLARINLPALALGAALLTGCASLEDPLKTPQLTQPASYAGTTADTANAASTNWRTYFNDPLLAQLIDTALARNLDLQVALQRVEMARAGARAARGAQLPTVGLNTTGAMRRFGLYTMDGAGNIVTEIQPGKLVPLDLPDLHIALQATWEVDIWGRLRNQRKAALSRMLASREGAHLVMTNVVADVAVAYYELVALDKELAIFGETVVRQEEALNVIQRQKDAGRANELAVQQFQAQLLGTKALQKETEQRIVATENFINLLLGRFPQPVPRQAASLTGPLPADPAVGLPAQLLRNRPDIRAAELEVMAARFDLKAARPRRLPAQPEHHRGLWLPGLRPQLALRQPGIPCLPRGGRPVHPTAQPQRPQGAVPGGQRPAARHRAHLPATHHHRSRRGDERTEQPGQTARGG